MVPRGHPRDSAPGSSPPGELPAPTEGKDRWHPGHLSAPSWVKPFALTRMPPPKPQSPGQSRLPDCTPDPLELIFQGAVSSFLAGPRVSGAQDAQHHTDPHLPQGYLVHDLQTTLWTVSLLFKSPPGEGGKISREDPSQLERQFFIRVSTAAVKPRLCRPSNDNRAFRRAWGDHFPPRPHQKPVRPLPYYPIFCQKGIQLHQPAAPSRCGQSLWPLMATSHVATLPPPNTHTHSS
nr:uncharacterized protein LOC111752660 [Loxodonta africana]